MARERRWVDRLYLIDIDIDIDTYRYIYLDIDVDIAKEYSWTRAFTQLWCRESTVVSGARMTVGL